MPPHLSPDSAAPSDAGLIDAVAQLSFMTMAVLNRVAAENDLSSTQLRVLAILRDRQVRMSELAAYLGLDRSTLTGLIDRAEKRGLVHRSSNPHDGRAVDVALSPLGASTANRVYADVARALTPLTTALGAGERDRLRTLLERANAAFPPPSAHP